MKIKVIISLFFIATSISACGTANAISQNVTNPNDITIETEKDVTYQDILDEYEQKLKSKTLNIVEEYNAGKSIRFFQCHVRIGRI